MSTLITVNREAHAVTADPETPLLYVLRNDLGLKSPRFGCGEGTCGACLVLIDGEPAHSCDVPLSEATDCDISTIEGLTGEYPLRRLQQAFTEEQAAQCGYCSTGILVSACALLTRNTNPTLDEIREVLDDRLCRCGSHWRMLRAVARAAELAEVEDETAPPAPSLGKAGDLETKKIGNEYVAVTADGTVALTSGKVDLGQGISTALAQIAADELGVSISRIRIVRTDTAFSPNEGTTAGSFSVEKGGSAVRDAAAALRARLLALAAEDLGSSAEQLEVVDGTITAPTGESISYWDLAGGADTLEQPGNGGAAVGAPVPRWDLVPKFRGEPSFIQDLELPGMVHGRVVRPPSPTARLTSIDLDSAAGMPGVVTAVRSGSFLGVVAEREEQAIRAARRLGNVVEWEDEPASSRDPHDPRYLLEEDAELQVAADFDTEQATDGASRASAVYTRPFLAHASIGPSCAIAQWEGSTLTVWSHTQAVYLLRAALARVLDLPEEDVRVIHAEGAGCYGHNGADDVALDAALLAREVPGRPVRLQWSREDEFAWEPYGPAMVVELSAGLDETGKIVEWSHDGWSHPHSARPGTGGVGLLAAGLLETPHPPQTLKPFPIPPGANLRNAQPLYDIPQLRVVGHFIREAPARTSALRSLGSHTNVFAIESFMDELAELAGADPVEFRLRHLSDPRARHVIQTVVDRAGAPVGGQNADGHGFGIAFGQYKNAACYVAVIAQIEAEHEVRLLRAWAAVDAGRVVNPDGVKNQIEGGMIQSASWALKEQVKFEDGRTATRSWLDYPILTFNEVPELDVTIVDRPDEGWVGVGEGAAGPTTAAIANGLRAALGVPVRDLPFTPDRVTRAILG